MQLDDVTISRLITKSFLEEFQDAMDVEVAIGGAGPAGMTAAYYLAKAGVKTAIFERSLRPGGGMPGGGMMFNTNPLTLSFSRIITSSTLIKLNILAPAWIALKQMADDASTESAV